MARPEETSHEPHVGKLEEPFGDASQVARPVEIVCCTFPGTLGAASKQLNLLMVVDSFIRQRALGSRSGHGAPRLVRNMFRDLEPPELATATVMIPPCTEVSEAWVQKLSRLFN